MTKCKRCKALEKWIGFCYGYSVTEKDLEGFYE